jgi:hypothetical protein
MRKIAAVALVLVLGGCADPYPTEPTATSSVEFTRANDQTEVLNTTQSR